MTLWEEIPDLPFVEECAGWHLLALAVNSFLPFMELTYRSPNLKSTSGELKVHSFGLATSASESLTTSSFYLAGPEIVFYPTVGFPLPHVWPRAQDSGHREVEQLRKANFRGSICLPLCLVSILSPALAQDSFLPKFKMQDHAPLPHVIFS